VGTVSDPDSPIFPALPGSTILPRSFPAPSRIPAVITHLFPTAAPIARRHRHPVGAAPLRSPVGGLGPRPRAILGLAIGFAGLALGACGGDAGDRAAVAETRLDLSPGDDGGRASTPDETGQAEIRRVLAGAFADREGDADGRSFTRGVRWEDLPGLVAAALDDPAVAAAVVQRRTGHDGAAWRIELRLAEGGPGSLVIVRAAEIDPRALASGPLASPPGEHWSLVAASFGRFAAGSPEGGRREGALDDRHRSFVRNLEDRAAALAATRRFAPLPERGRGAG